VIQYKAGDYEDAIETFSVALSLIDINDHSTLVPWEPTVFNLAQCYWKIGDYATAADYYQKALELVPDNAGSWTSLGFVVHMMGETDLAIDHYHHALSLNPEDRIAEEMLAKALKEFSENPFGSSNLGGAFNALDLSMHSSLDYTNDKTMDSDSSSLHMDVEVGRRTPATRSPSLNNYSMGSLDFSMSPITPDRGNYSQPMSQSSLSFATPITDPRLPSKTRFNPQHLPFSLNGNPNDDTESDMEAD